MFTGIIEELGTIINFNKESNGATIQVECNKVLQDTQLGDSISINGVCQTVIEISKHSFKARVSNETLAVTNFNNLDTGAIVNLERALTLNTRLGGHIVSGHIDCVGVLKSIEKQSDFYNLEFEIPTEQSKYIIYKGSITINGISLTIAQIKENIFKVAIIPHTYNNTNLKNLKIGSIVNIETDIIGKYVEKILSKNDNENNISMKFLEENGFV